MQQVKSESFLAGAQLVHPRALPVPVRSPRRTFNTRFGRAWILHHRAIRRSAIVAALLAGAVGLSQLHEPIGAAAATLSEAAHEHFAALGFAVGEISISGQRLTGEQAIFDALGIEPQTSSVSFDVEAARQRVADLPAISTVNIRKVYPSDVLVTVTEKIPVARWRVDGITFLIDATGEQIGEAGETYSELPLVVGDGGNDDAVVMIRVLDNHPVLKEGLLALSRIADRRWDLIYDTGLRVQLPENGVAQALDKLEFYQSEYQLLERDVTVIDLRVDRVVAVRPTKTDEELAADEEKRKAAILERAKSPEPYPMPPRNLPSQTLSEPILPQ